MKHSALSFLFFCWAIVAWGQKNDYVWLQGYQSWAGYDTAFHHLFGISKMDFNNNPVTVSYDSLSMNLSNTNTSYCDNNGNLLFYTNGIYVANGLNEKIDNSDSLNAGPVQYWFNPDLQTDGYPLPQGIIALEVPNETNKYYLLHTYADTFNGGNIIFSKLYYSYLDMDANGGHGRILSKNQTLINGNLYPEITSVRHANGRDWWMFVKQSKTNCYYKTLIDPDGIHVFPGFTCGGASTVFGDLGATCYSSDGSKFVYAGSTTGVNIFDFDRCSGNLLNPINILLPEGMYCWGVAISPNNRFLYVGATYSVYQYDLWAPNIAASIDTVARYDGYRSPFGSYFQTMQLGPDGKIYESCGNGEDVYHVIDRPDEKGDSCLFRQHAVQLPSFCIGVPNFPNYRLGKLTGSPCDTLTGISSIAEKEKLLKIYPNPATNLVTIDYGYTDWNMGGVSLELSNELGQVVYTQALPMYSGFQTVQVSSFPAGFYTASIRRKGSVVSAAKFAKQ